MPDRTHGESRTPLYRRWQRMKAREGLAPEWEEYPAFKEWMRGHETEHIYRLDTTKPFGPDNVRLGGHTHQMLTRTVRADSATGHKGVRWHKKRQKYQAHLGIRRKVFWSRFYDSIEEAIAARAELERQHHAPVIGGAT